jgi:hypothetical protein
MAARPYALAAHAAGRQRAEEHEFNFQFVRRRVEKSQETWCALDDVMRSLVERARGEQAGNVSRLPGSAAASKASRPSQRGQVSDHEFRVEKQAA